eukprot:1825396-Prymnesium_polylepis.1
MPPLTLGSPPALQVPPQRHPTVHVHVIPPVAPSRRQLALGPSVWWATGCCSTRRRACASRAARPRARAAAATAGCRVAAAFARPCAWRRT